jgi:hypothetical protein
MGDDEEIDVAARTLLASGNASVNNSRHNLGPQPRTQLLPEGIQEALEEAGFLTEKGPQEPANEAVIVPEGVEEVAADLPKIQNCFFMQSSQGLVGCNGIHAKPCGNPPARPLSSLLAQKPQHPHSRGVPQNGIQRSLESHGRSDS